VRAPAEFGRLHPFGREPLDRPGVDEHAHRFFGGGALRVALGDVDALDAHALHEPRPLFARCRVPGIKAEVAGDVEERLLDEPRHHAGIGAAAVDGGRPAWCPPAEIEDLLAQGVVGAGRRPLALVEIKTRPRLGDCVDVEAAEFARERHDVPRGGVDRQIDAKALAAAGREQRRQHLAVIVVGERRLDEADAAPVEEVAVLVGRIDDDEALPVDVEVPLDEGQRAAADGAEADHDDRAGDAAMHGPDGHLWSLLSEGAWGAARDASQ
jgi:hypothetical protein